MQISINAGIGKVGDAPMTHKNQETAFKKKRKPMADNLSSKGSTAAVNGDDSNTPRSVTRPNPINDKGTEYSPQGNAPNVTGNINAASAPGGNPHEPTVSTGPTFFEKLRDLVNAKITDNKRIAGEKQHEYRKSLAQQIDGADSLVDAEAIINSSTLPPEINNALLNAVRQKFKVLAENPTPEQWLWSKYEKEGLYADLKGIEEFIARLAQGNMGDIKQEEWKKFNARKVTLNAYRRFASGGAYNLGQLPINEVQRFGSRESQ